MLTNTEILDSIKNDELVFFYQPKVSLVTGKVYGAEALVRVLKPDGRIILPDAFIPVAERSSLIKDITRHMFQKLVQDMMVLTEVAPLSMSFNTSARDFEDDALVRMILNTIEVTGLPADGLQVELTETATLEAGARIKKNIMPLIDAGLGLAMDDFGKGYSSLETLSRWPFTTIKLDGGLVGRMFDSDKSLTIVETSVRMAHELGVNVVAEGVESSRQYRRLLEVGCTKIQGHWVSRPLPLDRYIAFVREDIRWAGLPVGLIHMAIIDHVQWRRKIVSELVRASSLPKDAPVRRYLDVPPLSDHECKLGHWYEGIGRMFKDRPAYRDLQKPHGELHRLGRMLVDMVADGADMQAITPGLRRLSECSMNMLDLLHALEFEGMVDMHEAHDDWMGHPLNPDNQAEPELSAVHPP
jgi:EAL domain-containing protein (putative c-di-GMP-specific phosphodiesterase class I)